jgi:type I restriction enzyme, S subunit
VIVAKIFRKTLLSDIVRFANGKSIKPGGEGRYAVFGSNGIIGASDEFRYENGIILGRVGAYCGSVTYCPNKFWPSDNTLVAFPASENFDIKFLFYLLTDAKLHRYAGGAAQPLITQTILKQVEVQVPPLSVQQRIAGTLSMYDGLIENNLQRIRILEEIARSIYREWFVKFRFPGHEKISFIDSALGPIPQGWEIAALSEVYNTSSGGTPSRRRPEYFEKGSINWVKSQELLDGFILSTEERITERALKESSAKLFPMNSVLVALYGATIGKLGILASEAATNQACCAVLPKLPAFGREFAFMTLLLNRERIIGLRLGAAQQNISQVLLRKFDIVRPPNDLVMQFSRYTAPLFDGTLALQRQVENLRRTRDLLLPRLMRGDVDLSGPDFPDSFSQRKKVQVAAKRGHSNAVILHRGVSI